MPGRSTRHQPSSLLMGLPQDLHIEIAARVGATSEWPLADLRSLRGTCSTMCRVCGHSDVGRCRMDLLGTTTSVGTRTGYSVGTWDYTAWAARHLMTWSTRISVEKYSDMKLCMSCTMQRTPRRTRLVFSPQTDL
jgi:hypothetical protein